MASNKVREHSHSSPFLVLRTPTPFHVQRQRESIQAIESRYNDGTDLTTLRNIVKGFRGIQALPPDDPDSFYCIAGFHGTPYRPPGAGEDPETWWGGYCHHQDVLFPMWHRAYLLRLENALRKVDGCENVRLPFWDELLNYDLLPGPGPGPPPPHVPLILTSPTFERGPNPLCSYSLQRDFGPFGNTGQRYVKPVGYETVRYPLSGLVGTWADAEASMLHNAGFPARDGRVEILNGNVDNWLSGTVHIPPDGDPNRPPQGCYLRV